MPSRMRASTTSARMASPESKCRMVPGTAEEARFIVKRLEPNSFSIPPVDTAVRALYPLVHSGYAGVAINGSQVGAATVSGVLSVSARVVAGAGRPKAEAYLARHTVM